MTKAYRRGISESQSAANAEALIRRGLPYSGEFRATTTVAWDWRQRVGPNTPLRELVRMAQRACAEEIPTKLHSGTELAPDGTPAMTPKAEAFIFGGDSWTDAGPVRCNCASEPHADDCPANPLNRPAISYYQTPFRAALESASRGDEKGRLYAQIVQSVTVGGQGPQEAALQAGVSPRCVAKDVAEDALRWILSHLTDIRVDSPRGAVA